MQYGTSLVPAAPPRLLQNDRKGTYPQVLGALNSFGKLVLDSRIPIPFNWNLWTTNLRRGFQITPFKAFFVGFCWWIDWFDYEDVNPFLFASFVCPFTLIILWEGIKTWSPPFSNVWQTFHEELCAGIRYCQARVHLPKKQFWPTKPFGKFVTHY